MTTAGREPLEIVFLDRETIPPETRFRPPAFPHRLTVFERSGLDEVAARIAGADIVITNKAKVNEAAIAGAKRLQHGRGSRDRHRQSSTSRPVPGAESSSPTSATMRSIRYPSTPSRSSWRSAGASSPTGNR